MRMYKNVLKTLGMLLLLFAVWTYGQFSALPVEFIMLRGQTHSLPAFAMPSTAEGGFLVEKVGEDTALTPTESGTFSVDISALGILRKTAQIHVVEPRRVVLGGEAVGIKMYMEGVLVIGLSEIPGTGRAPGKEAGIAPGDRILKVNGVPLSGSSALEKAVEESEGNPLSLSVGRGQETREVQIAPVYYTDGGAYKIGLWIRESAAGIGTVTFSIPENGSYAALGHPIEDADTGTAVASSGGSITDCEIVYIEKGEEGAPGAVRGVFGADKGRIEKNTEIGLYGTLSVPVSGAEIPVAVSTQVKKGTATIYSDIAGGAPKGYAIEIERILHRKNPGAKNMVVRITDERLLSLTGGIIQGMSGSPIIQNGKIIGAVTHVCVNL